MPRKNNFIVYPSLPSTHLSTENTYNKSSLPTATIHFESLEKLIDLTSLSIDNIDPTQISSGKDHNYNSESPLPVKKYFPSGEKVMDVIVIL